MLRKVFGEHDIRSPQHCCSSAYRRVAPKLALRRLGLGHERSAASDGLIWPRERRLSQRKRHLAIKPAWRAVGNGIPPRVPLQGLAAYTLFNWALFEPPKCPTPKWAPSQGKTADCSASHMHERGAHRCTPPVQDRALRSGEVVVDLLPAPHGPADQTQAQDHHGPG